MLILLKQLNAPCGAPALLHWLSSLPSLAEDTASQVGTLNLPEHKGGCAPDQAPRHPSTLRGGPWVDLEHSEMLPSCGLQAGARYSRANFNKQLLEGSSEFSFVLILSHLDLRPPAPG